MANINKTATIKRVKKFFESDLEKYKTVCASAGTIKAVNYENIKVTSSTNPSATSERILALMNYQAWLKCATNAINNCIDTPKKPYKTILELRYIQEVPVWQIVKKLNYSDKSTRRKTHDAFLNFADMFLLEQINQDVKDILDLHRY